MDQHRSVQRSNSRIGCYFIAKICLKKIKCGTINDVVDHYNAENQISIDIPCSYSHVIYSSVYSATSYKYYLEFVNLENKNNYRLAVIFFLTLDFHHDHDHFFNDHHCVILNGKRYRVG